ncbi:MAG: hypothetical protein WC846_03125 [Candidatus Gracilibacteria bacterium]|jgi:hypothetical protein
MQLHNTETYPICEEDGGRLCVIVAGNPLLLGRGKGNNPFRVENDQGAAVGFAVDLFNAQMRRLLREKAGQTNSQYSVFIEELFSSVGWADSVKRNVLPSSFSISGSVRGDFLSFLIAERLRIESVRRIAVSLDHESSTKLHELLSESGIQTLAGNLGINASHAAVHRCVKEGAIDVSFITLDLFRAEVQGLFSSKLGSSLLDPSRIIVLPECVRAGFALSAFKTKGWRVPDINFRLDGSGRYSEKDAFANVNTRVEARCVSIEAATYALLAKYVFKGTVGELHVFFCPDSVRVSRTETDAGLRFAGERDLGLTDAITPKVVDTHSFACTPAV